MVAEGRAAGRAAGLGPRQHRRTAPLDEAHASRAGSGARRAGRSSPATSRYAFRAAISPGRCGASSKRSSAPRRTSRPAAIGSSRRSTGARSSSPRSGSPRRRSRPNTAAPERPRAAQAHRRSPRPTARWIRACAARTSTTARSSRSTTGPATCSPTSAAPATHRDDLASAKFDPKYDVAGDGVRQPGSAWKPILYATAFDAKRLTPGSVLLDITTEFDRRQDWAPRDADQLERGPVLVRKALQYSLNIPAIRALERVGNERSPTTAESSGIRFTGGRQASCRRAGRARSARSRSARST